ncbi:MAG: heavy metal translocating P-type ATPase [Chlamydiia bacterium]|nr:heavy metal translocating P-type ATPase [Chlamydiia bacterium]
MKSLKTPYLFDEFFASGMEESVSPFLTPSSRKYGKNLSLKSAGGAAFFLAAAFAFSFSHVQISYLLLSLVYFLVGTPALIAAAKDLRNLEINIDILMTSAAFVAVLIGSPLEGGLLLVLFELSHGMENTVSNRARGALHHLNDLAPKFAYVLASDGTLYEKAVREISIGEKILIKTGEVAPLDGKVIDGVSSINLVHLTGESLPQPASSGTAIPAGARNLEAALLIQVTRVSSDSTLSHIIQLITQAHEAKPRLQRLLDRFGTHYATAVISLTFIFALALPLLFTIAYFGHEGSIYRSLSFLIAASPCALIIATPTAYLSAISACARRGILLKGGITLDALASCKTIAFDKTGTLTTGELACSAIEPLGDSQISLNQALSIAYGLERQVVHPIATAICKLAAERQIQPSEIASFHSLPGLGLGGIVDTLPVFIGRPEKLENRLSPQQLASIEPLIHSSGSTILAILIAGTDLFLFRFTDSIRPQTLPLIQAMKTRNRLKPIMLTGDKRQNAEHVGHTLGIETIYSDLTPEEKLNQIATLTSFGGLAMVGDGVNDAPALARATVGISMGKIGSRAAIDASDVVLLNDDLHLLSWLFFKSHQTQRIVKQNLTLALSVICLVTLPALFGFIPLWLAVLMHEGGTVLVGLNSLRLFR